MKVLIPVAQYLRMSTDQQQYSFANQEAANRAYAEREGFEIVKTFADAGKSGISLRKRSGLSTLLEEVISAKATFKAVLVYDVSRWGRFQDTDEAAHYEFVCKHAQVPVHYCAETFHNEDSMAACIMKGVKRAMAAEYSRELGNKVLAAEKRWAELGFKQGGPAGYGLRRVLTSAAGTEKLVLKRGELKCLQSDRVMLIPGPPDEVECVREMFRLVVEEQRTPFAVARELNRRGITCRGRLWSHQNVYRILRHPKYAGCSVWNRTSRRLGNKTVQLAKSEWILKPMAFEPVVPPQMFEEAQRVLNQRTCCKSDEELVNALQALLAANGKLSGGILQRCPGAPSPSVCRRRFGNLREAFQLAGFRRTD